MESVSASAGDITAAGGAVSAESSLSARAAAVLPAGKRRSARRGVPKPEMGQSEGPLLMGHHELLKFQAIGDWGRQGGFNESGVAWAMAVHAAQNGIDFVISVGDNFYPRAPSPFLSKHTTLAVHQLRPTVVCAPLSSAQWMRCQEGAGLCCRARRLRYLPVLIHFRLRCPSHDQVFKPQARWSSHPIPVLCRWSAQCRGRKLCRELQPRIPSPRAAGAQTALEHHWSLRPRALSIACYEDGF